MSQASFIDEIKNNYRYGGAYIKLIYANVIVFLFIGLLNVLSRLLILPSLGIFLNNVFTLNSNFNDFLFQPWGLFTSIFAHFGLFHLLFNMLMLFFTGKIFESFFGSKKLVIIYFLGGLAGGLFEILAHSLLPSFQGVNSVIVGASGSIMAIFVGLAFYRPNLMVALFGVINVKIIYLALIYILYDFLSIGANDGTAHFAHLGGAIIGILSSRNPFSKSNILNQIENLLSTNKLFQNKKSAKNVKYMKDEDFNLEKKKNQEKTDQILDKISKSGYDSLSKSEKEFLFKQSK
jgi:membrane associated rhomboid family serine protease